MHLSRNYKLSGARPSDLCSHNAEVANTVGRDHLAQAWTMLAALFEVGWVLRQSFHALDGAHTHM